MVSRRDIGWLDMNRAPTQLTALDRRAVFGDRLLERILWPGKDKHPLTVPPDQNP
jgi:hypothetical protein